MEKATEIQQEKKAGQPHSKIDADIVLGSQETSATEEKEKKNPVFTAEDFIFAILFFAVAFFFVDWISLPFLGAGVTGAAIVFIGVSLCYAYKNGFRQTKESFIYLAVIGLSALQFCLFDAWLLKFFMFVFILAISAYWVSVFSNKRIANKEFCQKDPLVFFFWDLLNQILYTPFENIGKWFGSIGFIFGKKGNKQAVSHILLGIALCLPLLFVVIQLLTSADFAFAKVMEALHSSFQNGLQGYLFTGVLAIPVCCLLYGLLYGNIKGQDTTGLTAQKVAAIRKDFQILPHVSVYILLTALNFIYVVFFLSQSAYLFSAFCNSLPETFTYAEYARHGFFQLCIIAGINLSVLGITHLLVRNIEEEKQGKVLKVETISLSILTLLLISTAVSKMGMYIYYYGLTKMRVYTTWFMLLLALLFILIILRQIKQFNGSKAAFIMFVISFFMLCYGNADGVITSYNVHRFESGSLEAFNPWDYKDLSAAAVPPLAELYDAIPADGILTDSTANKGLAAMTAGSRMELKQQLYNVIGHRQWFDHTLKYFNVQAAQAQAIADKISNEAHEKN